MMHILCLGINHRTADLSLRERLAYSPERAKAALARLGCGGGCEASDPFEMVILSTCSRVEIYAVSNQPDFQPLESLLSETRDIPKEQFSASVYRLADREAVRHLFNVAAGLDSIVVGEPQILGQVTGALALARSQDTAGPLLSRLFQAALHTGKRARGETEIGHNPASISSVAVRLAEESTRSLVDARIAILGAGEMAELAVEALRKRGSHQIRVVNRSIERAKDLAQRWSAESATFESLDQTLDWADIIIASTGAPHTLIHTEQVSLILEHREGRPLIVIDIAAPRDVDLEVGELPGVRLFDLDSLRDRLKISLSNRAREIPKVQEILEQEEQTFLEYLKTLDVLPFIADLRQQVEQIRRGELEKTLRKMDLSPDERERLEAMTQALVKKILHSPISRLRAEAGSPSAAQYISAARYLFGL